MADTPSLAALLDKNAQLFAAYEVWANAQIMLLSGTIDDPDSFDEDGGTSGPLGYYPVVNVNGQTIYVPCLARLASIAEGVTTAAARDAISRLVDGSSQLITPMVINPTHSNVHGLLEQQQYHHVPALAIQGNKLISMYQWNPTNYAEGAAGRQVWYSERLLSSVGGVWSDPYQPGSDPAYCVNPVTPQDFGGEARLRVLSNGDAWAFYRMSGTGTVTSTYFLRRKNGEIKWTQFRFLTTSPTGVGSRNIVWSQTDIAGNPQAGYAATLNYDSVQWNIYPSHILELPSGDVLVTMVMNRTSVGVFVDNRAVIFRYHKNTDTWSMGEPVPVSYDAPAHWEASVTRSAQGKLFMNIRVVATLQIEGHGDRLAQAVSMDEGATWSPAVMVGDDVHSDRIMPVQLSTNLWGYIGVPCWTVRNRLAFGIGTAEFFQFGPWAANEDLDTERTHYSDIAYANGKVYVMYTVGTATGITAAAPTCVRFCEFAFTPDESAVYVLPSRKGQGDHDAILSNGCFSEIVNDGNGQPQSLVVHPGGTAMIGATDDIFQFSLTYTAAALPTPTPYRLLNVGSWMGFRDVVVQLIDNVAELRVGDRVIRTIRDVTTPQSISIMVDRTRGIVQIEDQVFHLQGYLRLTLGDYYRQDGTRLAAADVTYPLAGMTYRRLTRLPGSLIRSQDGAYGENLIHNPDCALDPVNKGGTYSLAVGNKMVGRAVINNGAAADGSGGASGHVSRAAASAGSHARISGYQHYYDLIQITTPGTNTVSPTNTIRYQLDRWEDPFFLSGQWAMFQMDVGDANTIPQQYRMELHLVRNYGTGTVLVDGVATPVTAEQSFRLADWTVMPGRLRVKQPCLVPEVDRNAVIAPTGGFSRLEIRFVATLVFLPAVADPTAITFTAATHTDATVDITGSANNIAVNQIIKVAGSGFPSNTYITGQVSGTPGGDGTYTTSAASTSSGTGRAGNVSGLRCFPIVAMGRYDFRTGLLFGTWSPPDAAYQQTWANSLYREVTFSAFGNIAPVMLQGTQMRGSIRVGPMARRPIVTWVSASATKAQITNNTETVSVDGPTFTTDGDESVSFFCTRSTGAWGVAATGTWTFAAQPANNTTIKVNGVTFTFVTGAPTGNQIQIGADLATTLTNAATTLSLSALSYVKPAVFTATATVLTATFRTVGADGNTYTIDPGTSGSTVSHPTLFGGAAQNVGVMRDGGQGDMTLRFDARPVQ